MDSMPDVLKYFLGNAAATMSAIFYWMAVENMQPVELKQKVHQKLALVFFLSLLITPFGAWIASVVLRVRSIPPSPKDD
jgi:predicted permease